MCRALFKNRIDSPDKYNQMILQTRNLFFFQFWNLNKINYWFLMMKAVIFHQLTTLIYSLFIGWCWEPDDLVTVLNSKTQYWNKDQIWFLWNLLVLNTPCKISDTCPNRRKVGYFWAKVFFSSLDNNFKGR